MVDNFLNDTEPLTEWLGLRVTSDIAYYIRGYICIFVVLAFQAVVNARQRYYRALRNEPQPSQSVLFKHITRNEADTGMLQMLMYLANYGFYRFGVEVRYKFVHALKKFMEKSVMKNYKNASKYLNYSIGRNSCIS